MGQTIFSFVVDNDARFTYEGWHLARSLVQHCGGDPATIHIQCTPEVDERRRSLLRAQGYCVHEIERFGDGRYCNKIAQLNNLREVRFDCVVLLDTDTIAVADLRPFLSDSAILAKIVDLANPPLGTLTDLAAAAGLSSLPAICPTDAGDGETFVGNCNGGFYCIPKHFCDDLSASWRRQALWLLDHVDLLRQVRKESHIDQVSFCFAVQSAGLPIELAPSNVNYYIHFTGAHTYCDAAREIALLHYHGRSLNVVGLLEPRAKLTPAEHAAVARANEQIGRGFDNRVFWDMRYQSFPKRGSGLGSRGANLYYKRNLLREQGVEGATSVLDVGCGDLEVVKDLRIAHYIGIDQSPAILDQAQRARPDWDFRSELAQDIPAAEMVLCFEVLIHQKTRAAYHALVDFLAHKTLSSLLVSGYVAETDAIRTNPMVFFHEPLELSLRRTGQFKRIMRIGSHTNVVVYRCDV